VFAKINISIYPSSETRENSHQRVLPVKQHVAHEGSFGVILNNLIGIFFLAGKGFFARVTPFPLLFNLIVNVMTKC
jgi:hypothetical protein